MKEHPVELPVGTYRLKADVANPQADRRSKGWRYQPIIKAGTLLVSDDFELMDDGGHRGLRSQERQEYVLPRNELYQLLAANLEPVTETPTDLLYRLGTMKTCRYVLDQLVRDGKITIEDVQAAYDAHTARQEES